MPDKLALIVAASANDVIGADGGMPWHLSADLKRFKRLTMGHHIIMGRKTYESINRLLPGRTSIIVTRQNNLKLPGALIAHNLEEAIALCAGDSEIFIIGGGELYRAALPLAGRIYLTVVDAEPIGDTRMPEFDLTHWRLSATEQYHCDERHAHDYRFEIYDRVAG